MCVNVATTYALREVSCRLSGMAAHNTARRLNAAALTTGYTAVRQRPTVPGFDTLNLLTVTHQLTHVTHPAIRVTAHADRGTRGWTERDTYRLRDLIAYAARTHDQPLVLVARNLHPTTPATMLGAQLALVEAAREIEDRLRVHEGATRAAAEAAAAALHWWRTENADLLA